MRGLGVLLLLAGFAAGYAIGRRPAPAAAPALAPPPAEAVVPATSAPAEAPAPRFDPRLAAAPLSELLDERRAVGERNAGRAAALDHELTRRMSGDPEVLEELLKRFRGSPDRGLAALLGSFRHPRVEAAALELSGSGFGKSTRLIALEILDRLDVLSAENASTLIERLRQENDPEVLGEGLYALPAGPLAPETRGAKRALLRGAAEHVDVQVRARALIAMGQEPLDDEDLPTLLAGLKDPAGEVRATAAAALRNYRGGRGESARAALVERMGDASEAAEVRRQAWRTLAQLPMDEATWRAWDAYKRATLR